MTVQNLFDPAARSTTHQSGAYERSALGENEPQASSGTAVTSGVQTRDNVSWHIRTQLLRRIAHDIASPTGVTTTALEELANGDPLARPELMNMARRGLRRLLRLSEQLALVAELETAPLAPETMREDLGELASSAIAQAVAIDGRRGISANLVPPAEKVWVHVDRRLVVAVIREIVGNGLRIAKSTVRVTVEAEGDKAIVRVEDDGIGFSEKALAAAGERFTPNASARGLGLSLSIAHDVVAAHGGTITFAPSALPPPRAGGPRGAAVTVLLPAHAGG